MVFSGAIYAQKVQSSVNITTADGLSQGVIFDILQDSEGFMWFGTKDGLNRYDGYQFEVFTNNPDDPWSISGNTIRYLFEDSKGRIWLSVDNKGLDIYEKKSGRFYHIPYDTNNPAGISGGHISSIIEDTSGYFILNVNETEINMLKLEDSFFGQGTQVQVIRIPMPESKFSDLHPQTLLRGLIKDKFDRIWVGGIQNIYRLDVQKAQLIKVQEGFSIGAAAANEDGSIWSAGQYQYLFRWDGENARLIPGGFHGVHHLYKGDGEQLWAVRADSVIGLDMSSVDTSKPFEDINKYIFYRWSPSIENEAFPLFTFEIDKSGIIWVGTNGYGLYQINLNQAYIRHGLPGNSIRKFVIADEKKFFIFTYAGWYTSEGVFMDNHPLIKQGRQEYIDAMWQNKDGSFWVKDIVIGNNKFLLKRYGPGAKLNMSIEIPWVHYDSQPMTVARDGRVWLAGFGTVLTGVDPETRQVYSYELSSGNPITIDNKANKIISKEYSKVLYEDHLGELWVGTENGVFHCRLNNAQNEVKVIKHYTNIPGDATSLSYNNVICLLEDPIEPERFLWVCTKGGGLNRLDRENSTFLRLDKEAGLPDNVVYSLLSDKSGNLWGSTNKGIFCLFREGLQKGEYSFRNFSQNDGLQGEEFNTGAYAQLPDGKMVFGGVNGFNILDPEKLLKGSFKPPVRLTRLLVNNREVKPGDETKILQQTINFTDRITLGPDDEILTIEFASLDFAAPERNKYRYQLIGLDNKWVEAGNQRTATFLHFSPGDYTFRVQATNGHGEWSDQIAELKITVLPPWWKTYWAYLIYLCVLVTGAFTVIRFYLKREKLKQDLNFEKREAERIRELETQKSQLFMNMTHEFRTPLTIILGMARQMKDHDSARNESGYDMIIRNGQNLLGLVNKMLNLSRLESGKMLLELVSDDVIVFLRSLVASFHSLVEQKDIQLHFLPEMDSLIMAFDPDKLQQVVSNLISNAYKFTPPGGNIYIIAKQEESNLVILVKDTGKGIAPQELEKVFDRFYQADSGSARAYEGSGIGLALAKELVNLMSGTIRVASPPAGAKMGTEFIVSIPVTKVVFNNLKPNFQKTAGVNFEKPLPEELVNVHSLKEVIEVKAESTGITELKASETLHPKPVHKPIILLVEDNVDVVAYIASCFKNETSAEEDTYELVVAENGEEGLEMAIDIIPDLIISDVMMPVKDGFALCKDVKSDSRTDHIPVVMLTARVDMKSKLEGLELGANAYLPKPFERQELLLTVKNLFALRNKMQRKFSVQLDSGFQLEARDSIVPPVQSNELVFEDKFVEKVANLIQSNLADSNFNVSQMASELYLSHSQLARKLEALTGYSPNRFIRLIRLTKARELLKDPELTIHGIAYDCGFNDPGYFARIFKKEFGQTPGQWREEHVVG